MNPLPLVFARLAARRASVLAVVALIATACALGVAVSMVERATRDATTRASSRFDLIVGARGSPTQLVLTSVFLQPAALDLLPAETLARLEREPGAVAVAPIALGDSYRGYPIVGTRAEFAAAPGLAAGRLPGTPQEALLGSDVDVELSAAIVPHHGAPAQAALEEDHDLRLRAVGRVARTGTPWDRAIIVPIETMWQMHASGNRASGGETRGERETSRELGPPWPEAPVPAIVVTPRSVADAYALRAAYRTTQSTAIFPAEVLVPLYRLLGDARDLSATMAIAFQALLVIAVLLAFAAALGAQRENVAVLRALGASRSFIFLAVWLEAAAVIAAGIVLGGLLGVGVAHALAAYLAAHTGLALAPAPGLPEAALLGGLALGASLAAALPALLALRGDVDRLLGGA